LARKSLVPEIQNGTIIPNTAQRSLATPFSLSSYNTSNDANNGLCAVEDGCNPLILIDEDEREAKPIMTSTPPSPYLPVLLAAASSYPYNSTTASLSAPSSPTQATPYMDAGNLHAYNPSHTPALDDTSLSLLPRSQVDYLSHDWEEEDVWRSWRNMTRQKNEMANGVRLENASWRTWWKQRNGLGTVKPETLNW
jgi:hypothetical protein